MKRTLLNDIEIRLEYTQGERMTLLNDFILKHKNKN